MLPSNHAVRFSYRRHLVVELSHCECKDITDALFRYFRWTAAKDDCTSALKIDPCYVKAYHRRALALKELNCVQEAIDDLTKALQFEPNNATLRDDLARLKNISVSSTKVYIADR